MVKKEDIKNDPNYILLQILRYMGTEGDNSMYLYDVEKHLAYFNQATAKLFDVPEIAVDMPESVLKKEFIIPESQQEFIRVHHMIENEVNEITTTIKLKNKSGVDTVYELRLTRILTEDGEKTAACLGRFKNVTERYVKDNYATGYSRLLTGNSQFRFVYNKKKDVWKFFYVNDKLETKEKSFYFYTKMVKEEQVCMKNDIPIILDFLERGSEKPIQIQLFDQALEEYRWFSLVGKVNDKNQDEVVGLVEDITDTKKKGSDRERLFNILDILSADYLFIAEIDLINDTYEGLLGDFDRMGFILPQKGKYSSTNEILCEQACEGYRQMRLNFGKIENIIKELKDKEKIVCEFKTKNDSYPWRKAVIQRGKMDEDGYPVTAFVSHINIDENEIESQITRIDVEEEENSPAKILIVEDFELNAKIAIDNARTAGMNADWASSKEEALSKIKKSDKPYKMILMSEKLKDATGEYTSVLIRDIDRNVPIILCSLNDSKELDEKCEVAGINSHVAKPLVAKQLLYLKDKYVK